MGRYWLLLLVVVPALEIWIVFELARLIGGWSTFLLMIATGLLGAWIVRTRLARVIGYARQQMAEGQPPTRPIMDGICIFLGGVLLMLPGFLGDLLGLLLIMPWTRPLFGQAIYTWIRRKLERGQSVFFFRR